MQQTKKKLHVSLVSCPTTVLLDKSGTPYSPVRTNYFPHAQVLLATEVKRKMQETGVMGTVNIVDLKSLREPADWRHELREYGVVQYGEKRLTKCLIGNGLERIGELAESDIVGITSNFTSEANSVRVVIGKIKSINPKALIVVGGRDASARPLFYKRIGAHLVAAGDADISFPHFVVGRARELPLALDESAFLASSATSLSLLDFSLLSHLARYTESGSGDFLSRFGASYQAAYLETSRGCDRECDFCTERLTVRKNFAIQDIKKMILHYKAHGIKVILFSDDNLLERLNNRHGEAELIDLFTFLRHEQMIWEFSVGIEIGRFFDKTGSLRTELLDVMFWNNGDPANWQGAFRMLAPFENLDRGLHLYKKMRPWEDNLAVLGRIAFFGIAQINMGVMFGWPNLSFEDLAFIRARTHELKEVLDAAVLTRPMNTGMNLSLFCTMPLPGTPFYEEMRRLGLIAYDIEEHPELWNVFTSVLTGEHFSPEQITEIRRELIVEFASEQPEGKVRFQGKLPT